MSTAITRPFPVARRPRMPQAPPSTPSAPLVSDEDKRPFPLVLTVGIPATIVLVVVMLGASFLMAPSSSDATPQHGEAVAEQSAIAEQQANEEAAVANAVSTMQSLYGGQ